MKPPVPARGLGCAVLLGLLLLWQAIASLGLVRPIFLSSPLAILRAPLVMDLNELGAAAAASAHAYVIAITLSLGIGLPLGIALGLLPRFAAATGPLIAILQATPRVAFAPLLILWLGVGIYSVIALIVINALVPVMVTSMTGVRNIDQRWLDCARAFGANTRLRIRAVLIPASIPYMISGVRLAVGRGLVSMVVGEIVASTGGLGYLIRIYAAGFQTDRMFVGLALVTLTGVLLDALFVALERRVVSWRSV